MEFEAEEEYLEALQVSMSTEYYIFKKRRLVSKVIKSVHFKKTVTLVALKTIYYIKYTFNKKDNNSFDFFVPPFTHISTFINF